MNASPQAGACCNDILAVIRPGGTLHAIVLSLGSLFGFHGLEVKNPYIFAAVPVGNESDFSSIRAIFGLGIKAHAFGELFRLSAAHGQFKQVAHIIKDELIPVWMYIQR